MLWVMLPPVATASPASRQGGYAVAATNVGTTTRRQIRRAVSTANIRVAIEIVFAINRDVVVATPAATPTPASAPECAHHHADAKRDRQARGVVPRRRIVNGG